MKLLNQLCLAFLLGMSLVIIACQKQTSQWQQTSNILWQDSQGNLGFKTKRVIADPEKYEMHFITYVLVDGKPKPVKELIDLTSFQQLNDAFYKDKNHIYQHYKMSDGGILYQFDVVDYASFQILNDCYAKDKHRLFDFRNNDVSFFDMASFQTCDTCWCLAKDKNGYYFYGEKINPNNLLKDADLDNKTKMNIRNLQRIKLKDSIR